MAKRRPLGAGVVWAATTVAVTGWVSAKTEQVTIGNAFLVGAVAGTILTVAVARTKK
jgi:hypothetical protein